MKGREGAFSAATFPPLIREGGGEADGWGSRAMTWKTQLPAVRGKLLVDEALAPFTWFRVGGPADVVFLPADEQDLADFLKALDPAVPVLAIGVGSNLLVRDGGVEGVVIRLGKGFNTVEPLGDNRIKAGSAVPDAILARKAADAGIAGLEFYAGIPGTIGGAVIMNAGCYGSETVNVILVSAWGHGPPGPGARQRRRLSLHLPPPSALQDGMT
jgi:hypothetical protein